MKAMVGIVLIIGLTGCASMSRDKHYADLAAEHDFSYYFPSRSFNRTFATLDEAYEFVNTATAKFAQTVNKPPAKGLAARLRGPVVSRDKPVALGCFMRASSVDLAKIDRPLENVLRDANSASIVFLVFFNDRGTSISRYYLKPGYVYTSGNSQAENFNAFGNSYKAEYPIGWGTEKAFSYLKGEID
ncbi:MAG: hypothetical protein LBQ46_00515 [Treponema sp.]|jgi:hypothetical protein|nr:hypothetical protein [Treponema sp.]